MNMKQADIEEHLRQILLELADLESKLEREAQSDRIEMAYIDAAQLALQRLLDPGGKVADALRSKGAWRF
jgi:hypothetical protein